MSPSVTVVGAGPTGLVLAGELARAGLAVRVLEKRTQRTMRSRAIGLEPRTLEQLDLCGVAEALVERGLPWRLQPMGDRKGFLDYGRLDTPFPYVLILAQSHTEEILADHAVKAGVEIVRDAQVVGLDQSADSVTLHVRGADRTWRETSDYVVGCDGVRSDVRAFAGIGFTGLSYPESLIVADVRLSAPPPELVDAKISRRGLVAVFPLGDDVFRLVILDHERMRVPLDEPVTAAELSDSVVSIFGEDLGVRDPVWMSRFRSEQRLADSYRAGRVLLAGDAAHTHLPSGGQGLQMGVQDAMNLGWKLAAEAVGWAPSGLLDSYAAERRPIAAGTLRKTDLAFRFETSDGPAGRVARWLTMRLMRVEALQGPVVGQLAGLGLKYRGDRRSRLSGRRMPDAPLHLPGADVARVFEAFRGRTFVLLHAPATAAAAVAATAGWTDRVRLLPAPHDRRRPDLVLARPDGYVAWAGRVDALPAALRRWCGEPVL